MKKQVSIYTLSYPNIPSMGATFKRKEWDEKPSLFDVEQERKQIEKDYSVEVGKGMKVEHLALITEDYAELADPIPTFQTS